MPHILILHAHSGLQPSRVNRPMTDAARTVPHVLMHDLYETYPDFDIDVEREQALADEADLIVFQHPVQWYGVPALLKEWMDAVLTHGWAYGTGGDALRGKDFWIAATTGGDQASYRDDGLHGFPFDAFLPPLIQTARLCGMRWLPPLVLHGAHHVDDAAVTAHVARYRMLLESYPAWTGAEA
ncbi:MAG: NAD(P)H-dependent oxidoreductase [Burkholderiaceae bacterium]